MAQEWTFDRGARLFGAYACALLALIELMWITRDFVEAAKPADVWWLWAGMPSRAEGGVWGTSLADPVLLCVCTAAAIAALRSESASGALASTGVLTIVLRLPTLWMLQAGWMRTVDEGLRTRAMLTAWAGVVLGIVLLLAVAAGRPHAGLYGDALPAARGVPAPGRTPVRPDRGVFVTVFVLLTAAAGTTAAWQVSWARQWGWRTYQKLLVGDGPQYVYALLQPPFGWFGWTVAAVSLAGAVAALGRTSYSRPLGMTAAAILLARGLTGVSAQQRTEALAHIMDLPARSLMSVGTASFETLAGLVVLVVLAGCTASPEPFGDGGYASAYGPPQDGHSSRPPPPGC
jgi:hypothetical protein